MKISELVHRLKHIQEEYETEDIDVTFSSVGKIFNLEWVDLARSCTDHLKLEQYEPDTYFINLRGTERK